MACELFLLVLIVWQNAFLLPREWHLLSAVDNNLLQPDLFPAAPPIFLAS
jgi:hypothetical protein